VTWRDGACILPAPATRNTFVITTPREFDAKMKRPMREHKQDYRETGESQNGFGGII
jgi:hypothetical protein